MGYQFHFLEEKLAVGLHVGYANEIGNTKTESEDYTETREGRRKLVMWLIFSLEDNPSL